MKCIIHAAAMAILFFTIISTVHANELSDIEISNVMEGEIIVKPVNDENGIPGLIAAFSISSTNKKIWNVLVDYENFTKAFDGVNKLKVIRQDKQGAIVEFWVNAVLADLNYTLYRKYEVPNYKLTWKRLEGDLEVISGSWQIVDTPIPDKKIVIYSSFVKVGKLVPTKLVRWGAMRKTDDMCKKLIKWIGSKE